MTILLLDNYDSFTYNLLHYLEQLSDHRVVVKKNDEISLEDVAAFDRIILSPGPGLPAQSGIMPELIKRYASSKPILGVCLGHQAIAEAFGGQLKNLKEVHHGVATDIRVVAQDELFANCPPSFAVGRYHSWVVDSATLPAELEVTAIDASGEIMAFRHKLLALKGVQFHPESILTEHGLTIMKNWVEASPGNKQK